jgi:hypothetical protein
MVRALWSQRLEIDPLRGIVFSEELLRSLRALPRETLNKEAIRPRSFSD